MNKLFYVARFEFIRHIKRRGFIFAVLGLPTIFIGIAVIAALFFGGNAGDPIGVLDQSGVFIDPADFAPQDEDDPPIFEYADEAAALSALNEDEIQAFFVVSPDYLETGRVTIYHGGNPNDSIYDSFYEYARTSLLQNADSAVAARFIEDALDVNFVSLSEDETSSSPLEAILPFIFGFMIIMAIFTTGGYLLQAVVDEKENRTMEILATSLRPSHLIIGKILGLVALGFVQLFIWSAGVTAIFLYFRGRVPELAEITFPVETALVALLWFVPFYFIISALWTSIGLMVTEVSEGQQAIGIISLLTMSPLYLLAVFIQNPDGPLAVAFTMIPFTSPLTVLMRRFTGDIPLWQMGLSWAILLGTAVLALFAVSRLLRIGMLRYGKRVTIRELASMVRG